jgi:hypothetical protein
LQGVSEARTSGNAKGFPASVAQPIASLRMQLAGTNCAICGKNVLLDSDASWCARCASVLHRECLEQANGICPSCQKPYEAPEGRFVFSRDCPECFRFMSQPEPHCRTCGARTRWDTQADYDDFLEEMKDTSRVCVLRGAAELGGAILCLLAIILMFTISKFPLLLGVLLLGIMMLTADGLASLAKSRRIARFR